MFSSAPDTNCGTRRNPQHRHLPVPPGWKYGAYLDADFAMTRGLGARGHPPAPASRLSSSSPATRILPPITALSGFSLLSRTPRSTMEGWRSLTSLTGYDRAKHRGLPDRAYDPGATGAPGRSGATPWIALGLCSIPASSAPPTGTWPSAHREDHDGHPEATGCGAPYETSVRRCRKRAFRRSRQHRLLITTPSITGMDRRTTGLRNRWQILRDNQFDPFTTSTATGRESGS